MFLFGNNRMNEIEMRARRKRDDDDLTATLRGKARRDVEMGEISTHPAHAALYIYLCPRPVFFTTSTPPLPSLLLEFCMPPRLFTYAGATWVLRLIGKK